MVLRCERKLFDFFPYRQKKSPTDAVGLLRGTELLFVNDQNYLRVCGQISNALNCRRVALKRTFPHAMLVEDYLH